MLSPLPSPMSPPTLSVKPCLRSTKMLPKRYQVTFFNDTHADSILVSNPTSLTPRSVVANFRHVASRFEETKPIPSLECTFVIYMATSYEELFAKLRVDVYQNRLTKRKERKTMPR